MSTNQLASPGYNPEIQTPADISNASLIAKPSQSTLLRGKNQSAEVTGYLGIDDVDQPAMPVGEWVIDPQAWPLGRSSRLTFQVWISATGVIDHWELIGDLAGDTTAMRGLQQLSETIVNPALLNGLPVASFRLLEVVINRE
ncbi:MAG: hypothetical protein ABI606_24070 [Rhodoferax sp.]